MPDRQCEFSFKIYLLVLHVSNGGFSLRSVHQPSAVLFENFDELILLKSGGETVYCGPLGKDSQTMIQYFEKNGASKCLQHMNPTEYVLEEIGASDPNRHKKDWGKVWIQSGECHQRMGEETQGFILHRV